MTSWFYYHKEEKMNIKSTHTMLALICSGLLLAAVNGKAESSAPQKGQVLFEENCAVCHPQGGNIINPAKPLDRKTLAANGINSAADIVAIMRNPGPGMTRFGPEVIPQEKAEEIARYILKTF
jgi:cytochrome c6